MDEFTEYFSLAATEALTQRENWIVELRYGLNSSDYRTLEEVGQVVGVSRERIRQILAKAHRKIRGYGKRQIQRGLADKACAQLLLWLYGKLKSDDDGATERVIDFVEHDLTYLPPLTGFSLIQCLMQGESDAVDWDLVDARIKEHRRATVTHAIKTARLQALLSNVIWPRSISTITRSELTGISRVRDVSEDGDGYAGTFNSIKTGRVVQFESQLELDFLLQLEESVEVIHYQEQPLCIAYQLGERELAYYPDILFVLADGRAVVAEIKPIFQMALYQNLQKWSALKHFCASKGWGMLITDGRYAIQEVQRKTIMAEFAEAVLSRLDHGSLSWPEYKALRDEYNADRNDFLALVLQKRLLWTLGPFKLARHDHGLRTGNV